MVITIDGLSANGKTTLAKMISEELHIQNFNTGAIYRCIGYTILKEKLDINNISDVIEKIKKIKVTFEDGKTFLNGEDVTDKIREEEVTVCSNKWATILEIKDVVRNIQKDFIKKYDSVMEGRDIGTRIAKDADFKFYLYADFETRVNRLWGLKKNIDKNIIRENLKKVDDVDINEGNFIKPENAIEIDTSNLSIDEVYNIMINHIKNKV
mgnify:CR=1 FL=1